MELDEASEGRGNTTKAITGKDSGFFEVWTLCADSVRLLGWCLNLSVSLADHVIGTILDYNFITPLGCALALCHVG